MYTHDHSTMAVRTLGLPRFPHTQLDPPPNLEPEAADMQVIASSIASLPAVINTIDIGISGSHSGNFTEGQVGAQYQILVSNNGDADSSRAITHLPTPFLPEWLPPVSADHSWSCTLMTLTCTSTAAVLAGSSAPAIPSP